MHAFCTGDCFQLPGVHSTPIESWPSSTSARVLFLGFDRVVELIENYRAKDDAESVAILARLRYGALTDSDIATINQLCYKPRDVPIEHVVASHRPVICQRNTERQTFNRRDLIAVVDVEAQRLAALPTAMARMIVVDAIIDVVKLLLLFSSLLLLLSIM
jgi:hypothetical protein